MKIKRSLEGEILQLKVGHVQYIYRNFNIGSDICVAARALATYLIPGCVGRGVRLESEGSSVGGGVGGGVWEPIVNLS